MERRLDTVTPGEEEVAIQPEDYCTQMVQQANPFVTSSIIPLCLNSQFDMTRNKNMSIKLH